MGAGFDPYTVVSMLSMGHPTALLPSLTWGCQSVPFFTTLTGQEQRFTRLFGSSFTSFATEKKMEILQNVPRCLFFTVNK